MFILKQTRQNRFSSYKVGEIMTTKVEFKLIKVGKLNIKKAFKILVGVFFFSKYEYQSRSAKKNRLR
jgi:hypothetical protein